jgi:tuberculosinol/isotuberculosinol synthase
MDYDEFQRLSRDDVARLVRQGSQRGCAFPINGTRRWFLLEHRPAAGENWLPRYMDVARRQHIELYRLLFDHGLDTLLTPIFGPDLLDRGEPYLQVFIDGLAQLAAHPELVAFYQAYQVRVRFYGDHRRFFGPTPFAYLSDLFDEAAAQTAGHDRYRLFYGVCAHDAAATLAELAVNFYAQHGCVPDRQQLVELYYGEYVAPMDLFIGFDKFCTFDMPLVASGDQDLYFTVCPSPYLTERQLRDMLYDHLYSRRGGEPDYEALPAGEWRFMREFYRANQGSTLGLGTRRGQIWYPLLDGRRSPQAASEQGSHDLTGRLG